MGDVFMFEPATSVLLWEGDEEHGEFGTLPGDGWQIVTCHHDRCGKQLPACLMGNHVAECKWGPAKCLHDGCSVVVRRRELEAHMEQCGWKKVKCAQRGCNEEVIVKEMAQHLEVCQYLE